MTETIDITQDSEYDDLDGVGSALPVFWARGHGHDARHFIRAVLDYCLDNEVDIPAITGDAVPVETWQQNVSRDGAIEYRRDPTPPPSTRSPRFPITLLDLYRRSRGGTRCSIHGCDLPWSVGPAVQVVIEPTSDDTPKPHMAVQMWLCREHSRRFPEPSYRVFMVPVGATVLLPSTEPSTAVSSPS